jgi:alpha-tubulin suppressor-like RCC1 family protein
LIQKDKENRPFENIADIACGANHCLALSNLGISVYSWGNGQGGRLGHGNETGEYLPKEIKYFKEN